MDIRFVEHLSQETIWEGHESEVFQVGEVLLTVTLKIQDGMQFQIIHEYKKKNMRQVQDNSPSEQEPEEAIPQGYFVYYRVSSNGTFKFMSLKRIQFQTQCMQVYENCLNKRYFIDKQSCFYGQIKGHVMNLIRAQNFLSTNSIILHQQGVTKYPEIVDPVKPQQAQLLKLGYFKPAVLQILDEGGFSGVTQGQEEEDQPEVDEMASADCKNEVVELPQSEENGILIDEFWPPQGFQINEANNLNPDPQVLGADIEADAIDQLQPQDIFHEQQLDHQNQDQLAHDNLGDFEPQDSQIEI